ncbi:MAG: MBL fold metallo-hydrolase [Deltaproteobacteria bacterium]|nr:MBL fold metallo-hydrolase [Deltaproteobacteria bacterium]
MIIEHFSVAPLGCNCVILGDEERGTAIVVDPGGEAPRILARLDELGLKCHAIVHTHTHFDHIGATKEVQEATQAPTMIHEKDLFLYEDVQMQLDAFQAPFDAPEVAEIDRFLSDGDTVLAGGLEAEVVHTPGHSPGSICLTVEDDRPVVIAGDTLFARSVGRTDLWGSDTTQLLDSIQRKLFALPDETLVICGHGPSTTIGEERRLNPFVRGAGRDN